MKSKSFVIWTLDFLVELIYNEDSENSKGDVKTSSSGIAGKAINASFVGAKTVNGPSPCKTLKKSVAGVSSVKAVTSVEKLGSAAAKVTTVGIFITASTMCIVPFEAPISAVVTVDTPLKVTPSEVLKYKLIALLFGPLAEVFVYPAPVVVKSLAVIAFENVPAP